MADPICRWRNISEETFSQFNLILPLNISPKDIARDIIEKNANKFRISNYFKTAYQSAKQLGLFYEDSQNYYPQLDRLLSLEEITIYIKEWLKRYYIPNPYVKGFKNFDQPKYLINGLLDILNKNESENDISWDEAKRIFFEDNIGNDDILINLINNFSDELLIENGILKYKSSAKQEQDNRELTTTNSPDNKEAFFNQFSNIYPKQQNVPEITFKKPLSYFEDIPRQKIIYGAPGTGKSFDLQEQVDRLGFTKENTKRVTFHPNYSYQQFVGTYKPTPIYKDIEDSAKLFDSTKKHELAGDNKKEPIIDYTFVPGPFLTLLVEAMKEENKETPFMLIIEEINRASVASVFGDIFQLLDRDKNNISEYEIEFNADVSNYLKSKGIEDQAIRIPSNLFIWATMNSADQGVMPLDSAFKRRWSFEYLELDKKEVEVSTWTVKFQDKIFFWNKFRKCLNEKLISLSVPEDKLIGPFFLKESELKDDNAIKNKLLIYLRDDVVRHNPEDLFKAKTFSEIIKLYDSNNDIFKDLDLSSAIFKPKEQIAESTESEEE